MTTPRDGDADDDGTGVEPNTEVLVQLDLEQTVQWASDYLRNDAPPSIMGKAGNQTLYDVAQDVRDTGISLPKAIELINTIYNVEPKCVPVWPIPQLKKTVGNAYKYSKRPVGNNSAEADFADVPVEPETEEEKKKREKAEKAARSSARSFAR